MVIAPIITQRLALLPITPESLQAEWHAPQTLTTLINAAVPANWPTEHWEPHVFELILSQFEQDPSLIGWHRYITLCEPDGELTLVGALGAFRWPHAPDEAEVGYSVLPQFERRGYATEALQSLLPWLRSHGGVDEVIAHTFPKLPASIRVLEKCGFILDGPGKEEDTVRYRQA